LPRGLVLELTPGSGLLLRLRGCEETGFLHNPVLSILLILKNSEFFAERFFHSLSEEENLSDMF
jgi:hypothetical protein